MGTLLALGSFAGLMAGLTNPRMRTALLWIAGLSAALFGLGVLLMVTSPAATDGAWFTAQQIWGFLACALAVLVVGLTVVVAGLCQLVAALISRTSAAN